MNTTTQLTWRDGVEAIDTLVSAELDKQAYPQEAVANAVVAMTTNLQHRDYFLGLAKCDNLEVMTYEVEAFIEVLDVKKFYGIGKVTAEKMYQLGIYSGTDLKSKSLDYLEKHFGNSGNSYYNLSRGISFSQVKPNREMKSVGAERTFNKNLSSEIYMEERLKNIAEEIERRIKKYKIAGKTITLKIKYSDFSQQTRSKTVQYFISDKNLIFETAKELLYQEKLKNSVRLLGISLNNLNTHQKKFVVYQLKFEF